LRNVGREDAVRVDLRIIEETVGSLQFGRLERLWKRTLRTARESASQRNKTLRQARITQISLAKFGTCPVICLVLVDQSRLPLRTEWAKANIDIDCLQAIIHYSARKMWVILRLRTDSARVPPCKSAKLYVATTYTQFATWAAHTIRCRLPVQMHSKRVMRLFEALATRADRDVAV
jgi:hypothetical protein